MPHLSQQLVVIPGRVTGTVFLPPSKSQSLRAILFSALAEGTSRVEGLLDSPDVVAMIEGCRALGAEIAMQGRVATIAGIGGTIRAGNSTIDVGNSGLALRFLSAIAALGTQTTTLTGDDSICGNRPMVDLLSGLSQLGAVAVSQKGNGYAPVTIRGPIHPGAVRIQGHDSQPVSALLMAAAMSQGDFTLRVDNPGERPWVALTLEWLERFGVDVTCDNFETYVVRGRGPLPAFHYRVPGDLSSCAFPVAAALVTRSQLVIENVDLSDSQGDKQLFDTFRQMGAAITQDADARRLVVEGDRPLRGIEVDINPMVDGIVALAVVACYAEGQTVITNGAVARDKECDRVAALTSELSKMGARITERPDGLVITGSQLHGAQVLSYGDHRMAMGLAVAALGAEGVTALAEPGCIKKTYPTFVEDFRRIGVAMEVET